jgi:ornithine cyclodeaminase/alanine dehydrogenase-like protein (mu-crystallin family)
METEPMATHELVYLTQQEVIDCGLSFADAIRIVEGSLLEHGLGEVENPPKPAVHPLPDAFLHAMPGYLKRPRIVGLKWVSGFFSNPARGLPSISGLIILNDADSGLPTAVMDCAYITALRTAAVSAAAARRLARRDSTTIGLVGAGVQGRYNVLALRQVLPALATVQVFDANGPTLARFVADVGRLSGLRIVQADSISAAFAGADVVITATGWLDEPIFFGKWVGPGALILPIHARGWEARTIRDCDKLIVDDWGQFHHSTGEPGGIYHPLPPLYAQLGEIVAGRKSGRENAAERIIDFNYGLAIHDVAMATEVLSIAKAKGLGTRLAQMDGRMPWV